MELAAAAALGSAVAFGLCDFLAGVASRRLRLGRTALLAGLYPAVTVLLAVILLHERPDRSQLVGLALAAVAVVLIVAS